MNAPHFDVTRIPIHPSHPDWMSAVIREEQRVCGPIDERMAAVTKQFVSLSDEATELASRLKYTRGFFARWGIRRRIKAINRRILDNMSVSNELVTARLNRTYGA